jgi:hypothetical protein
MREAVVFLACPGAGFDVVDAGYAGVPLCFECLFTRNSLEMVCQRKRGWGKVSPF